MIPGRTQLIRTLLSIHSTLSDLTIFSIPARAAAECIICMETKWGSGIVRYVEHSAVYFPVSRQSSTYQRESVSVYQSDIHYRTAVVPHILIVCLSHHQEGSL